MRDANRRISGIHRLAARPGGAERIDADVLGLDVHFHFVRFGQHRHGDRRSVHAALLLRHRNALHAMHAALVFQLAVDALAAHQGDDFFEPAHRRLAHGSELHAPALRFGVARIHAEDFCGEQRGFIAAGAGADFEHHVLFVVGILGQQQDLQLFLDLGQSRLHAHDFLVGHLAHFGIGIRHHAAGLFEARSAACFHSRYLETIFGKLAVGFGGFTILLGIADHGGIGQLARQLFKTHFDLIQLAARIPCAFRR